MKLPRDDESANDLASTLFGHVTLANDDFMFQELNINANLTFVNHITEQ